MVGNVYYVTKYKLMYSMATSGNLQNYVDEKGIGEQRFYTVFFIFVDFYFRGRRAEGWTANLGMGFSEIFRIPPVEDNGNSRGGS